MVPGVKELRAACADDSFASSEVVGFCDPRVAREPSAQFHMASAGIGRTRNQCSITASVSKVASKVSRVMSNALVLPIALFHKIAATTEAAVTETGNNKFMALFLK